MHTLICVCVCVCVCVHYLDEVSVEGAVHTIPEAIARTLWGEVYVDKRVFNDRGLLSQ